MPLSLIDERVMDIPASTDVCFSSGVFKVLIFLEADHHLILDDDVSFKIRSGDLLVIPVKVKQTYRGARKGHASRIHALRILLDLPLASGRKQAFRPSRNNSRNPNLRTFLVNSLQHIRHVSGFISPQVQGMLARLRGESENRRSGYCFEAGSIALSLLIEAIRKCEPPARDSTRIGLTRAQSAVERAKEYLSENFRASLSLDQIAWNVRLSREHLSRIFRAQTGQTVFQYLTDCRLHAAKSHLCNANLLVLEVAAKSGFKSVPLFCRTFKEFVKMTPLEYRMKRMSEVRYWPSTYADPRKKQQVVRKNLF